MKRFQHIDSYTLALVRNMLGSMLDNKWELEDIAELTIKIKLEAEDSISTEEFTCKNIGQAIKELNAKNS